MEETFYKRVNYPENKPENKLQEGGSPIPYTVYCESNVPEIDYWFKDNEEWGWLHSVNVTHWLKPFSFSRDKMIEVIKQGQKNWWEKEDRHNSDTIIECIADAIIKAGVPERTVKGVLLKKAEDWWDDEYGCGNCRNTVEEDQKYCDNCGSKIIWV